VPGKRQTRVIEELLCRQIGWLPPIKDGLGDIRREIAEADEPREIGAADTFPLGEYSKGDAFAVGECHVGTSSRGLGRSVRSAAPVM
jgi:hypothetical protein